MEAAGTNKISQITQADYPQSNILVLHGVNRRGEPLVLTMPLSDDPVKGDFNYMVPISKSTAKCRITSNFLV